MTGRAFSGWMREAGLQAGEQIRMKKEGGRVLIQRVPADRRVRRGSRVCVLLGRLRVATCLAMMLMLCHHLI